MRIPRIYLDQSLTPHSTIQILADRAHYILRVLRMKKAQKIILFNGQGGQYEGEISVCDRRSLTVRLGEHVLVEYESLLNIHLQQSLLTHDKMDLVIQKAVELGVSAFTPVVTARSKIQLDERRLEKRMQHWHSIIISACEQCGRNRLPQLNEPLGLTDAILRTDRETVCLALLPGADRHLAGLALEQSNVSLLVGPEGGFADDEVGQIRAAGYTGLVLGPRVLRTETAGIAAVTALQSRWGDLA